MSRIVRIAAACVLICTAVWWRPSDAAAAQPATWNFAQAAIPGAQPLGDYGKGVLVAVVDTWVDPNDTQFGGRVIDEADCVGSNGSPSSCRDHTYAPDACTHGTHVAGTIASASYGVAPEADLLAVQALSYNPANGECTGSTNDVAAAIDFAVAKGAKVINLSLGDLVPLLFQSGQVTSAIAAAAAAGVVVVVAAGNSGLPWTDNYGTNAIMVAATGPSGQLASYSDSFVLPEGSIGIAAPGGDTGSSPTCAPSDCILSTLPGNQFGLMEGTSMATPHVSGTAALLLAEHPGRGRAGVIQALVSTARPLSGASGGLLDATAALELDPPHASAPVAGPTVSAQSRPASSSPLATTGATSAPAGTAGAAQAASGGSGTPTATPTTGRPAGTSSAASGGGSPPGAPPGSTQIRRVASAGTRPAAARSWADRHGPVLAAAAALVVIVAASGALLYRRRARRG
ncbi:MAG TPA: S8 family serine peptidase [Acidimicrobiales bacterium]|nr:S8 family serine peptidase [Acidimicrobiales bacterium]